MSATSPTPPSASPYGPAPAPPHVTYPVGCYPYPPAQPQRVPGWSIATYVLVVVMFFVVPVLPGLLGIGTALVGRSHGEGTAAKVALWVAVGFTAAQLLAIGGLLALLALVSIAAA